MIEDYVSMHVLYSGKCGIEMIYSENCRGEEK